MSEELQPEGLEAKEEAQAKAPEGPRLKPFQVRLFQWTERNGAKVLAVLYHLVYTGLLTFSVRDGYLTAQGFLVLVFLPLLRLLPETLLSGGMVGAGWIAGLLVGMGLKANLPLATQFLPLWIYMGMFLYGVAWERKEGFLWWGLFFVGYGGGIGYSLWRL